MALYKDGKDAVGSCLLACIEQVARRLPTEAENQPETLQLARVGDRGNKRTKARPTGDSAWPRHANPASPAGERMAEQCN